MAYTDNLVGKGENSSFLWFFLAGWIIKWVWDRQEKIKLNFMRMGSPSTSESRSLHIHERFRDRKGKWGAKDTLSLGWGALGLESHCKTQSRCSVTSSWPCHIDRPKEVISDNLLLWARPLIQILLGSWGRAGRSFSILQGLKIICIPQKHTLGWLFWALIMWTVNNNPKGLRKWLKRMPHFVKNPTCKNSQNKTVYINTSIYRDFINNKQTIIK